jgi:hypothetical protein
VRSSDEIDTGSPLPFCELLELVCGISSRVTRPESRVFFTTEEETHPLPAGQSLSRPARMPHSTAGAEDSLVFLTVMFH